LVEEVESALGNIAVKKGRSWAVLARNSHLEALKTILVVFFLVMVPLSLKESAPRIQPTSNTALFKS